jgi:hypothetical protein
MSLPLSRATGQTLRLMFPQPYPRAASKWCKRRLEVIGTGARACFADFAAPFGVANGELPSPNVVGIVAQWDIAQTSDAALISPHAVSAK